MDADQASNVLIKPGAIGNPAEAAKAALEAATAIWDNYKAKIEEVAKAQAEATGKIMASANEAMAAMKALNEALHPLTTAAGKDEQDLARRIDQLKTTQAQQKELNQANEAAELATATNEQHAADIRDKYRLRDTRVDEWTQSQMAGWQSAAAEQAQKQIEFDRFAASSKPNAGDPGQFASKTQGEADGSQFKSDTRRATMGSGLQLERFAEQATKLLDQQTAEHETLRQLLDKTGTSHEKTQNLLQLIIAKHLDLSQTVNQLHAQLDQIHARLNQPVGQ